MAGPRSCVASACNVVVAVVGRVRTICVIELSCSTDARVAHTVAVQMELVRIAREPDNLPDQKRAVTRPTHTHTQTTHSSTTAQLLQLSYYRRAASASSEFSDGIVKDHIRAASACALPRIAVVALMPFTGIRSRKCTHSRPTKNKSLAHYIVKMRARARELPTFQFIS